MRLTPTELPRGRLVVDLLTHVCAVVDGVLHDTFDASDGGTSWVHGYWASRRTGPS